MKKILSLIAITTLLASCGNTANDAASVDDVIKGKDIDAIKAKRTEVLANYDAISADLAKLEEALADLDTTKKLPIVTAFEVAPKNFKHYVEIQGDVGTKKNIMITPEFQGVLKSVHVSEGQRVSEGQLLATIDDGGLRQQVAQLEAMANLAKETFERQERLWKQKIGSEIQYLQAKSNHEAQQNSVAQMKEQLAKTSVKAPFTGVVDDVLVEDGEVVAPGSRMMRLVNLGDMYVRAEVPEDYIGKIVKGTEVMVDFGALGKSTEGSVRMVGNYINPSNRTFIVEVSVPNEDGLVKPNMIATLRLNDYSQEEALLIPDDIIQENAKGHKFVYVLGKMDSNGDAEITKTEITTGYRYNNMIEVLSGLDKGDVIVREGSKNMREGITVKVKS